jgi:hypothetical protein
MEPYVTNLNDIFGDNMPIITVNMDRYQKDDRVHAQDVTPLSSLFHQTSMASSMLDHSRHSDGHMDHSDGHMDHSRHSDGHMDQMLEELKEPEIVNCLDIFNHISSCPVCSKIHSNKSCPHNHAPPVQSDKRDTYKTTCVVLSGLILILILIIIKMFLAG